MKLELVLIVIVMSLFTSVTYGQTSTEFGHRLIPNKIVANTEGILQVYAKEGDIMIPTQINNLIITSSDSSIIQILDIGKNENGFITPVKVKAISSGTANIALAAPGFLSEEFPVTVYGNKNSQAQLLIKTAPDTFSVNGPDKGYVSVELADEDGFPTRASDDIAITLSTSQNDVIRMTNTELTINKGEYFAIGEFQVNQPGNALIYASSPLMETVSSTVTVSEIEEPLTVQLYVYPQKLSSFSTNYAYAIVQLQDSSGLPIKAKENIPISLKITNSEQAQSVNTSGEYPGITSNENPQIKKGSYWGYTKLVTRGGLEGTYDISIFGKDYLVSSPQQLEIVNLELLDDKFAKLDILPILATGQKELVGVIHLENDAAAEGDPVVANTDLKIKVDSSDEKAVSVQDIQVDEGTGAALVFGETGYTMPETLELRLVSEGDTTVTPTLSGPAKESLTLVAEPLIEKVLSNTDFPLVLYLSDGEEVTYFPEDSTLSIPPSEFVHVEPKTINKGQSTTLLDSKSLKAGSVTLSVEAGDFTASTLIDNLASKPAMIHLDYPDPLLTNIENTFSIQVLDGQELPVFATQDIEMKFVLNDQSVISVPESVTIKKGDYYTLFDVEANAVGQTELSVLASDLPLSKFVIGVEKVLPEITISSPDYVNPNTNFDLTITVQQANSPLSNMNVEWSVQGAEIQNMESVTDENGIARISLFSQDPTKVDVQASVSGGLFPSSVVSKQVNVNIPLESTASSSGLPMLNIGINPIFIIIPVAAAVGGIIVLKKKNMLSGLTEKISVIEKINEVKERISHLREK
ncbi:MAG: Ig-like domain-containing protein [Nitrosopumilaceae archaeon]